MELRQKHATKQLSKVRQWLDVQAGEVTSKSPLGGAIRYARNHWEALCHYTEDGELSIENNLSERALRCVAVGRKNWMFAGSDRGGETGAALFSLIASCQLLGVDPYHYLRGLLTELPGQSEGADLTRLLPDRWLAAHPSAKPTDHGDR